MYVQIPYDSVISNPKSPEYFGLDHCYLYRWMASYLALVSKTRFRNGDIVDLEATPRLNTFMVRQTDPDELALFGEADVPCLRFLTTTVPMSLDVDYEFTVTSDAGEILVAQEATTDNFKCYLIAGVFKSKRATVVGVDRVYNSQVQFFYTRHAPIRFRVLIEDGDLLHKYRDEWVALMRGVYNIKRSPDTYHRLVKMRNDHPRESFDLDVVLDELRGESEDGYNLAAAVRPVLKVTPYDMTTYSLSVLAEFRS